MACKVGMTTDPNRRKQEWMQKYQNLRNWKILERNLTYDEALEKEKMYANKYNCDQDSGGQRDNSRNWVVYCFDY